MNSNLKDELRNFTGTEHYYKSILPNVVYTDGVKYMAQEASAYWLVDKIASMQLLEKLVTQNFQAWKLKVKNDKGSLQVEDGNDHVLLNEAIEYTDFPLDEIDVWAIREGQRVVLLLPSEY